MLRPFTLLALATGVLVAALAPDARAQKTIAIVNLSEDASSADEARKARLVLDQMQELRPTTPGDLARALEDALPEGGPDGPVLAKAAEALATSQKAFSAFKSRLARSELDKARRHLFSLAPGESTSKLLADVSFRMALIHLREQNHGLAMGELQLLHRLDERTSIDPVRYPPNVVKAFKKARASAPTVANARLSISATYDGAPVYIDGKSVGASPLTIEVAPGMHVVAIAARQYRATARTVDIDPRGSQELRIDLEPRLQVDRALELRFEARSQGLRQVDLKVAAARVSRLVGSDAVLVIADDEEGPAAALYIQHLDRLSFRHKVDRGLENMLALFIDVARPTLLEGPTIPGPVPWWKRPRNIWIAAGTGSAVLTAAGVLFLGGDTQDERNLVPVLE